jgi:hypothetical protein
MGNMSGATKIQCRWKSCQRYNNGGGSVILKHDIKRRVVLQNNFVLMHGYTWYVNHVFAGFIMSQHGSALKKS